MTYKWVVRYSSTKKEGTRISCSMLTAEVYASDEAEVRMIMGEEAPGMTIDKIERGEPIDEEE